MATLYPLKFKSILKEKIWGGQKLTTYLGKEANVSQAIGESWEISSVEDDVSVISNGFLQENTLEEIIEIYMGDIVGDKVFEAFGTQFPLLLKFIDANDDLSIQVHPNDELAEERHNSFGKTELWYVVQADDNTSLISGFSTNVTPEEYVKKVEDGTLESILATHSINAGDVFFVPAGRVHSIGKGALIAEIQQTSDVTYRIYDFNRKDSNGDTRELHTELAKDSIDYTCLKNYRTSYDSKPNELCQIASCEYFTTNLLELTKPLERDFYDLDSFLVYMCVEGAIEIGYGDGVWETLVKGETVLIPAELRSVILRPTVNSKLLEVYV